MNDETQARACTKLGEIGDMGYAVISQTTGDDLEVLATNYTPPWSVDQLQKWAQNQDSVLLWLGENLGTISVGDLEPGPMRDACSSAAATTAISDINAGSRLAIVISHRCDTLTEAQVNEARAAAIILQMDQTAQTDFPITAKELVYLEQVSTGATDEEIAADLQLSLRAVKERKRKAIDDLNAKNIGNAVGIAKRSGLI